MKNRPKFRPPEEKMEMKRGERSKINMDKDQRSTHEMEYILLMDGISTLRLLALILFDLVGDLSIDNLLPYVTGWITNLNSHAFLSLPFLTRDRSEEINQLDSVVKSLILLDTVSARDTVTTVTPQSPVPFSSLLSES